MLKLFSHGLWDEDIDDEQKNKEISLFNNMLAVLRKYIDHYNFCFLGAIVNKRKIDNVKKLITAFYLGGNVNNVIQFIEFELNYKIQEIKNLDNAKKALELAKDEKNIRLYNELLFKYFTEVTEINNIDLLSSSFDICSELFKNQIELQLEKCNQFNDALPDSSKFKAKCQGVSQYISEKYEIMATRKKLF